MSGVQNHSSNVKGNVVKTVVKHVLSGSFLNPNLSEENTDKTLNTMSGKDLINHFVGKRKNSPEDIRNEKQARKYLRFL